MIKSLLKRLATVVVSTALTLAAMTSNGFAANTPITFFDVCSGANFQQFFNKIRNYSPMLSTARPARAI